MNREIEFRGKRKDNNKWVYGYLQKQAVECKEYYITSPCNEWLNYSNEVIPETIGQYTWLNDKNGKKIFEGDIVMFDYEWTKPNETGVITWNKNTASFQIKGHIPSSSMKHLNDMKVIGNIYENNLESKGE